MTKFLLLPLVALLLSGQTEAYSSGAPSGACQSMLPGHMNSGNSVLPQNAGGGGVPFTVTLSKTSYSPGDTIDVTVQGVGTQDFSAFIIQARRADNSLNTVEPIGTFTVFDGAQEVCKQASSGAFGLTHTSAGATVKKTKQVFTWQAPAAATGHVKFRMTLAETKLLFWTGIESDVVNDPSAPPLSETTSKAMVPIRQIDTINHCGVVKGCYLHPAGCVESNCEFLLTYRGNGDYIDFEMSAATKGFVAVGFSNDDRMGSDSVIECAYRSDQNNVVIKQSYNQGHSNIAVLNPTVGLVNTTGYYSNGRLSCRFSRERIVKNAVNVYNLDQDYYLLLARGSVNAAGEKFPHDTSTGAIVSPEKIDTTDVSGSFSGQRRYPIAKAHGCLMVFAWVFCASFGMLLARYYKPMWPAKRLGDERVWFQIHRSLMISCTIITILSMVLIFIMVGGYSYGLRNLPYKAHPILGLIVMCLAIINPLIALCRPHPETKYRPIFNWCHWGIGTVAHVLSVPTMFIGLSLHKAHVPAAASWVLIIYVIVHCVCEILLEVHQCFTTRRNKEKKEEYELNRDNHPREHTAEPNPSGRFFKMFVLTVHGVLVGSCALAIIIMIIVW